MTNLNNGRFKCADEAQAVWNLFYRICDSWSISGFKTNDLTSQNEFDSLADSLHKARLIHGSICDEHGRIEDKDVAHYLVICSGITSNFQYAEKYTRFDANLTFSDYHHLVQGEIRGTIFY